MRAHDVRPRPRVASSRAAGAWVVAWALLLGAAFPGGDPRIPPIVFVSRAPLPEGPRAIPGLGPLHRAAAAGGRLMLREPDGRLIELAAGALFDAADPAVSFDGRRIAFAGTPHPDSAFRIYVMALRGGAPRAITPGDPRGRGHGDLDPCWISDHALCFATTARGERPAQYADVPVTNLDRVNDDGTERRPLTFERNGAEEPAFDPASGAILYARWWFNRFRAGAGGGSSATADPARAIAADSVNLWQAVELDASGGPRLACGALDTRSGTMAYQPAILADGTRCGVYAGNLGLLPGAAGTGIQVFPGRFGRRERWLGAALAERGGDAYADARGLAPASALAPAGLPDGRLVCAYDPGARGDFGLWVLGRDRRPLRLVDLPGTLELDPAPVFVRRRHAPAAFRATTADSFVFDCRDVHARDAAGRLPAGAPPLGGDLRLRVFAVAQDDARHDHAVLLREVPVGEGGAVRVTLPAETPLFEQLVDRSGAVVVGAHGPAHVAGLNWGARGARVRCIGCHVGHSRLAVREPRAVLSGH